MLKFSNLKTATKLALGFFSVIIIFSITNIFQITQTSYLNTLRYNAEKANQSALILKDISQRITETNVRMVQTILQRDADLGNELLKVIKKQILTDTDLLNSIINTEEAKSLITNFTILYHDYLELFEEMMLPLLEQGEDADQDEILAVYDEFAALQGEASVPLYILSKQLDQSVEKSNKEFAKILQKSIIMAILAMIAGTFIAIILGYLITRAIVKPLAKLSSTLQEVTQTGKFSLRLHSLKSKDEIGQLVSSFNILMNTLEEAVDEVNEVMGAVALGDFSQRVKTQSPGELSTMKEAINQTCDELEATMKAMSDLTRSLREGNFKFTCDLDLKGGFKTMLDDGEHALKTVEISVKFVIHAMKVIGSGQFNHRIKNDKS